VQPGLFSTGIFDAVQYVALEERRHAVLAAMA
jgi:hypothetical protein